MSEEKANKSARYLALSYFTAFIGGFCVMVIEIIAGRLIARYLGVSLYTWTSVIGVVLAGISLGNYIGGRIADILPPRRTLCLLFVAASSSCVFIPVLNNIFGNAPVLVQFSWPIRIAAHVCIIFFLPSCALGTISPVVAKFALEQGFKTGRTIGNIYAWGAAGSIAGTFVAGFFLIAMIGTVVTIWIVAGILALMALFYSKRDMAIRIWLSAFILLCILSHAPFGWAKTIAVNLFLAEPKTEDIIYEKDSQFSYVAVNRDKLNPRIYNLKLDSLIQTKMNIAEPLNLADAYKCHSLFIGIVMNIGISKDDPRALNLGGGGYFVPRYIKSRFPKGHVVVVELDPVVTDAAALLGLSDRDGIEIHHMDARNFVENAALKNSVAQNGEFFDFILSDVVTGGIAIPYHLTTYEYNEKVARILSPGGLYVINLIDTGSSPRFLRAMLDTLKMTFKHIYIFSTERYEGPASDTYGTYVIVASQKEIARDKISSVREYGRYLDLEELWPAGSFSTATTILTDDYAPVDNLLLDAFRAKGKYMTYRKTIDLAARLIKENRLDKALAQFKKAIEIDPGIAIAYNNIASIKARQGRYEEAIPYYKKAVELEPGFIQAMVGLANALDRAGQAGQREEAITIFYRVISIDPRLPDVYVGLGNALFMQGRIDEAIKNYNKALELAPDLEAARRNLNIAIRKKTERR